MQSLIFFVGVLKHLESRRIPLAYPTSPHESLYTDAAWEPSAEGPFAGLGAVSFSSAGAKAAAGIGPPGFIAALLDRETQIIPMELLAVIAALYSWVELFRGKLVIIWGDNQSVCSAIASGASIAEDIHALIAGLHWHCALNHIGV